MLQPPFGYGRSLPGDDALLLQWPHDAQVNPLIGKDENTVALFQSKSISIPDSASVQQGSIVLWVKPQWPDSHTTGKPLLTLRWDDSNAGYMALSDGWWEPIGATQLYFVIANQDHAFCTSPVRLTPDRWWWVAVTWRSGVSGRCSIHINGVKVTDAVVSIRGDYRPQGSLHIGSDAGAADRRNRQAAGRLAMLRWYRRELTDVELTQAYRDSLGGNVAADAHRWQWVTEGAAGEARHRVRASGEVRAIFDESAEWSLSEQHTDRILKRIKSAGFNVYVPCVWHGDGAYFPSVHAHRSNEVSPFVGRSDPLEYLIRRAHGMGIEVHPWFTVALRNDKQRMEWAEPGTPAGAYDFHNPEFRVWMTAIIGEVLERYPVDGVNLDYIRTMGVCASRSCIDNYRAVRRRDLVSDIASSGTNPEARANLQTWQDAAVRDLVVKVNAARARWRPHAVVSVAGHPHPEGKLRALDGRDEMSWLRDGLIDVVFAMTYEAYPNLERLDVLQDATSNTAGHIVPLFANYDRFNGAATARPGWVVSNLIDLSRRRWPDVGAGIYIRAMLSEQQLTSLSRGPFRFSAKPDWKSAARRGIATSESSGGVITLP